MSRYLTLFLLLLISIGTYGLFIGKKGGGEQQKARLVLHVGVHKTGTSSIQAALGANEKQLNKQGVFPLKVGRKEPGYCQHHIKWGKEGLWGSLVLKKEVYEIKQAGGTCIVSMEEISRSSEDELKEIKAVFDGFEFLIVMYVRDHPEWFQSCILQSQKSKARLCDFHSLKVLPEQESRQNSDFLVIAERFERVFGRGTVHARLYDRSLFENGNAVDDFLKVIGILDLSTYDTSHERNVSFTVEMADVIRENKGKQLTTGEWRQIISMAMEASQKKPGSKYFYTKEDVERIWDKYSESNALFAKKYLVNSNAIPRKPAWKEM